MTLAQPKPVPPIAFKNIIVTVREDGDKLYPFCVEYIACDTRDTLLNFQIAEPAQLERDYRFKLPDVSGDVEQFGKFTLSPSGKMLTVCNSTSRQSSIKVNLHVYDHITHGKHGSFDPEVANQPDGSVGDR